MKPESIHPSAARRAPFHPLALACAFVIAGAVLLAGPPAYALTVDEIVLLHRTGVSADIIISNIKSSGRRPRLSPGDVERLRKAGVPSSVVDFLLRGKVAVRTTKRTERQKAAEVFRQMEEQRRAERARLEAEARRLEAEKLRREAEKLKIEARKMAAAARAAKTRAAEVREQVVNTLRRGFRSLETGNYGAAAAVFHEFLLSGLVPPNSHRYVDGEFGLARTLYKAGLVYAAIPHLVEVLRRGPQTSRFDPAFTLLYRAVSRIDYSHPILALLGSFEPELSNRPANWKSAYHYLMGEFNERYDQTQAALKHFMKVDAKSPRHAAAMYHAALLNVRTKKARTALRLFRQALAAAAAAKQPRTADLANLALARLAYEVGSHKAASFYYRRIPRTSTMYWQAQYELAWSQLMAQRYGRALGTLHGLHAPSLKKEHIPDRFILEAAVYLNLCRYRDGKAAINAFRKHAKPLATLIQSLLSRKLTAGRLYRAALTEAAGSRPGQRQFKSALMDSVEVYRSISTTARVRQELARAPKVLSDKVLEAVKADLKRRHKALMEKTGLVIQRRLNELTGELEALEVKATEISLEIELAEKQLLEEETYRLRKGQVKGKKSVRKRMRAIRLRAGQVTWPFEGEYWFDEIGNYRSRLRSACRPAGAAKP